MKASFAIMLSVLATGVFVTPAALAVSYGPTGNSTAAGNMTTTGNVTGATNATSLAGSNATVTVTPLAQVPGGTVLVQANGLTPDANATIMVDNRVAGMSGTDENGTLLYALGVPDEIKITEIRVDNSGKETVKNETHQWEGTVRVVVMDGSGNSGTGELTVLKPVGQSGATVASNSTSNNTAAGNATIAGNATSSAGNMTSSGNTTSTGNMTSSGNATGTNATRP
jgi:hypothetical protein